MIAKIKKYFQGVVAETKKVVWPTRKEVRSHTMIVIATVAVAMVAFGFLDFGLSKLLEFVLNRS